MRINFYQNRSSIVEVMTKSLVFMTPSVHLFDNLPLANVLLGCQLSLINSFAILSSLDSRTYNTRTYKVSK